jgi:hypothetical protein
MIRLPDLVPIVEDLPTAFDVDAGDDGIWFSFIDKDRDTLKVYVSQVDRERLMAIMLVIIPKTHLIAGLLAANAWNGRPDSHGTLSYMMDGEDHAFVVLESHLLLRGGVRQDNIKEWLRNFTDHINPFEEVALPIIRSTEEDNQLMKGSNDGWSALGQLAGSFVSAWARS